MQEYHENQQILLHLHVIFSTCFLHHKLTGSTAKKPTLKLGSYTPISCVCISLGTYLIDEGVASDGKMDRV